MELGTLSIKQRLDVIQIILAVKFFKKNATYSCRVLEACGGPIPWAAATSAQLTCTRESGWSGHFVFAEETSGRPV